MEKTYFKTCDTEFHPEIKIRPDCDIEKIKNKKKSPAVAALLSCVVPGMGQVYAGDPLRGFTMLAALGLAYV